MICPLNESKHQKYINFLNGQLPTETRVELFEIPDCDTIELHHENGETDKVFAMFQAEEKRIYWPSDNEQIIGYTTLAHEYVHAWQQEQDVEFDEDEAEKMSEQLYDKYSAEESC